VATVQLPTIVVPWLTPLRDWLRVQPAVVALVGTRTYLGALPLNSTLPALVVWRAGGGHDGATMDSAMLQLEAWAASGAQAEALMTTAVAVLGSAPGLLDLTPTARLGGARLNAMMWAPDPDTDTARYVATLDVDVLASSAGAGGYAGAYAGGYAA